MRTLHAPMVLPSGPRSLVEVLTKLRREVDELRQVAASVDFNPGEAGPFDQDPDLPDSDR